MEPLDAPPTISYFPPVSVLLTGEAVCGTLGAQLGSVL